MPSPNFEVVLSLSDGDKIEGVTSLKKARFNQNFLKENIKDIQSVSRFLICGPPFLNKDVPEDLINLGVYNNKIHLV